MIPAKKLERIASKHGLTLAEMCSERRSARYVLAREDAIRMMAKRGYSLREMGRALGGRDHTTILYHCRKMGLDPVENFWQSNEARQPASPRPCMTDSKGTLP